MNPGEISTTTTTFANVDRRWLADLHGLETTEPGTVDGDLFSLGTFPDGRVPSGVVLARVTATGRLGPYTSGASNGLQTAVGHLLDPITVAPGSGQRIPVALVTHGAVIENRLPSTSGVDSAAKTALKSIRYRNI